MRQSELNARWRQCANLDFQVLVRSGPGDGKNVFIAEVFEKRNKVATGIAKRALDAIAEAFKQAAAFGFLPRMLPGTRKELVNATRQTKREA